MNTKSIAIICTTVILIGMFFWPTLYRYDKMRMGRLSFPVRIDRVTGDVERFDFAIGKWIRWVKMIPVKSKTGESKILPPDEQSKVTGKAGFNSGMLDVEVYNGSSWTITEMIIRVVAKGKDWKLMWDRKFKDVL